MLTDRIIGAFSFRREVYAEVEKDASFTNTAWVLVVIVAFLNQFGSRVYSSFFNRIIGSIVGTIVAVVAFAVAAFIIQWVARSLFNADVTFDELVRTLGLAYVWQIVGFIGIVGSFSTMLRCLLMPVTVISALLGLIASFIAAQEALDLDWVQTFVSVIIGWVIMAVITFVLGGLLLGALGISASLTQGILGS
jgi:hypothetical protein